MRPHSRRFGFITADQFNAHTVAHELGHGAFNLRHTFPKVSRGSTDNLMDYPPLGGQVPPVGGQVIESAKRRTGSADGRTSF